ncbi:MAG TPA: FAD-dependent monooxygenase [Acidimicrobiales bacterium]|nr:FAD-dependent monooxygenase [Acidimicrobiales bacterium]
MRVVVVGAGIGGLAVAIGLQRAGNDVVVLEEASALRSSGAAVSIWFNGAAALSMLEVGLSGHGRRIDRLRMLRPDGAVWSEIDAARLASRFGVEARTIARRDLIELLAGRLDPQTVRFAASVRSVRPGQDQATVELDGGETIGADLVVGADGQRSRVRPAVTSLPGPRPTGWASWQGLTPVELAVTGGTDSLYAVGPEAAVGLMPAGEGLLQWWFDVRWPTEAEPASVLGWLRACFSSWGSPVADLLASISEEDLELFPHVTSSVPVLLHRGRVVLIGDAAHAMPPALAQGANQTLDDARVLAEALAHRRVDAALAEYQRRRRRRAAAVVRVASLPWFEWYGAAARMGRHWRPPVRVTTALYGAAIGAASSRLGPGRSRQPGPGHVSLG